MSAMTIRTVRRDSKIQDGEDVHVMMSPEYHNDFKGSSDPSHFIFEINVGKSRNRHRTTLKLNFLTDSKSIEDDFI